jgi:hypothetical protein
MYKMSMKGIWKILNELGSWSSVLWYFLSLQVLTNISEEPTAYTFTSILQLKTKLHHNPVQVSLT